MLDVGYMHSLAKWLCSSQRFTLPNTAEYSYHCKANIRKPELGQYGCRITKYDYYDSIIRKARISV